MKRELSFKLELKAIYQLEKINPPKECL